MNEKWGKKSKNDKGGRRSGLKLFFSEGYFVEYDYDDELSVPAG